eukprot:9558010-Heterocapsa_arctica.AAC.1
MLRITIRSTTSPLESLYSYFCGSPSIVDHHRQHHLVLELLVAVALATRDATGSGPPGHCHCVADQAPRAAWPAARA